MSIYMLRSDLRSASKSDSFLVNLKWLLLSHTMHLLFLFRLGQSIGSIPVLGKLLRFMTEYMIRVVYASDISCLARIGPGLTFVHGHDIVIGADVVIGHGCKIFNGVTLGNKDTSQTSAGNQPTVGDNVTLSTGAKILGPVTLGDNVVVGANSVVIRDCASNTVVAGVPARVVRDFR
jgi:serine O-acetyltransferase